VAANIAAVVYANCFSPRRLDESGDGVTHQRRVEVTGMKRFKRIRVRVFDQDFFAR
jgi:hypothetical protein